MCIYVNFVSRGHVIFTTFLFATKKKGDDFYIGGGEAEFGAQSLCLALKLCNLTWMSCWRCWDQYP